MQPDIPSEREVLLQKLRANGGAARTIRLAFIAGGLVFAAIVILSLVRADSAGAMASGFFAAFFFGLLTVLGVSVLALRKAFAASDTPVSASEREAMDAALGSVLRELEALRAETQTRIEARAPSFAAIGAALGLCLALLDVFEEGPFDWMNLVMCVGFGALGGWIYASFGPSKDYKSAYKSKVLPVLARSFGELTYRPGTPVEVERLGRYGLFAAFDKVTAEDEIYGTHRDYPIRIVEVELVDGRPKEPVTVFDGILVEIVLPRMLTATTAITIDKGVSTAVRGLLRLGDAAKSGLTRVRLEDPEFERDYEVFSSDQIGARAFLTPAVMERLRAFAAEGAFGRPVVLLEANRFTMALPKRGLGDLFEPPSYRKPAATWEAIKELSQDIAAVLAMADAVIAVEGGVVGARETGA